MLTDKAIRNARAKEKTYRLADEKGLSLEVAPAGGRWWRFRYRFDGKAKQLSLGIYPDVSLADARVRRDEARKQLANAIDPSEHRKAMKSAKSDRAENSFEVVAREWYAKHSPTWAPSHANKIIRRLELYIFPWIVAGRLPRSPPPRC